MDIRSISEAMEQSTRLGRAFIAGSTQAAVASQYSFVQLWNGPGNAESAAVDQIAFTATAVTEFGLYVHDTAAGSLIMNGQNMLLGGDDAPNTLRDGTNASELGTMIASYRRASNQDIRIQLPYPIIIPPGYGLHVGCRTVNLGITANFIYRLV